MHPSPPTFHRPGAPSRDAADEWLERFFASANDMFRTYAPAVPEHLARRAALIRLDDVLHIESVPYKPLVHRFFHQQVQQSADDIERTKLTAGARIWKIYSHSWIVRTPSVTIAFDIVPGNQMARTVDHREDYTQRYNHLFGKPYPFILMSWCEGYTFR